ncbi:MAG: bifunctional [glutamate--ammonia ligase]-adenylyl-L-tyrosine phosphorylase/[glutamate--ammonia-ligase] adenylyltransferase [Planctomycetes bacterium]|nr:bifunctional [glutamate--ammonia ligase]-adenylyl-L-tyrosine phosphorylase/[glutamate--ammonia-ligase] adenylyltransferase [Planctomycetota bacterium]
MNSSDLKDLLFASNLSDDVATSVLRGYGFQNVRLAQKNIRLMAGHEAPVREAFVRILPFLIEALSHSPDPDMGLNNFERFAMASHSKIALYSFLEEDPASIPIAVQLFSFSQYFSDILIRNPEYFDWLRNSSHEEKLRPKDALAEELFNNLDMLHTFDRKINALRRFKRKELLRIGYLDLIMNEDLETITRSISDLADVEIEAALKIAYEEIREKYGLAEKNVDLLGFCIVALGKLGGAELNYSSDIDITFVHSPEGAEETNPPKADMHQFYNKLAELVVKILNMNTEEGHVFRVDTRLRPEGEAGPLARSITSYENHYLSYGETWERQALIKARPVAGNVYLGEVFTNTVAPFVYRKFLTVSEINDIKRLKRRIEKVVDRRGETYVEVKSGYGGIRDVEFTVQFLQLFYGGQYPRIRHYNTLHALRLLEEAKCIEPAERNILEESYIFMRKVEHRLQTMHELQVHKFSESDEEQRKLALRLGFVDTEGSSALQKFRDEYNKHTRAARSILEKRFHNIFGEEASVSSAEVDLILDPEHRDEEIENALRKYNFKDVRKAHRNIDLLVVESTPFPPSPRTRECLANIAPLLLRKVSSAPDPDMALNNLERCTASVGAKAVFFQMLSENPQALEIFVDLCAWSQFLSNILIKSPGMLDQLIDSLVIGEHKDTKQMIGELGSLLKTSSNKIRTLHEYKNQELLRIGVRDIVGKTTIQTTMEELSGLAEAILINVFSVCQKEMERGERAPTLPSPSEGEGRWGGTLPKFAIVALGKLGGREINYSSDLDVIFVYKDDGDAPARSANQLYFAELSQRLMKLLGEMTEWGTLYKIDPRLRPTGESGILVTSLENFKRYYGGTEAQLWERQALTKARWITGDEWFGKELSQLIENCVYDREWSRNMADEIEEMRERLEQAAVGKDIKRGLGGIVDIEFTVQLLQLKYGRNRPDIRTTNTLEALHRLYNRNLLEARHYLHLIAAYEFLRKVESRLRIVHGISYDRLPDSQEDLDKLAKRLGYTSKEGGIPPSGILLAENDIHTTIARKIFKEILTKERRTTVT